MTNDTENDNVIKPLVYFFGNIILVSASIIQSMIA